MIIDPVYEGKSMAGLIDLIASGEILPRTPRSSTSTSAASRHSMPTPASSTEYLADALIEAAERA